MQVQQTIENKLTAAFTPDFLQVLNESDMHAVPADSETHFKLVIVSDLFEGMRAVQRHQRVYQLLSAELAGGVHALALHIFTPDEWREQESAPSSPACMGKNG
ncbi:BolA/IbaG family iron-sulfur metabolism protein [uncultured Porticoccus sp.]|uniref:BolA family protein n=1 Tax=uncultured Porticoccus sp. TaxID=1256050 RepID=UPI00261B9A43|nr:BolA/IbaG family iron-sulfur metabolism protein [uncultured Porticoccus sp.]